MNNIVNNRHVIRSIPVTMRLIRIKPQPFTLSQYLPFAIRKYFDFAFSHNCVFRPQPNADSGNIRTLIPVLSEH